MGDPVLLHISMVFFRVGMVGDLTVSLSFLVTVAVRAGTSMTVAVGAETPMTVAVAGLVKGEGHALESQNKV